MNAKSPVRFRAREPWSGYSHLVGFALALVGAPILAVRAGAHTSTLVTSIVYGACLVALYAASAAYHLVPGSEAVVRRLRKLDHSAIFLMIAGSSTPFFWHAFEGRVRIAMMTTLWVVAAAGIAMRVLWMHAPRALYTAMYVAMGWLFVVQGPKGFRNLPLVVGALVLAGGLTYTAGAVVYATKRPNPVPKVFGFHEIWHLFVLGGSAFHYAAVVVLARS